MKMRKNWKRFWALNRHHADGFTLVELIVVIAILAILGGVAIPAYSGYVKKANMGADQTLVSEVAHALTLYHYSNPDAPGGYVVLTMNAASGDGTVGDAAMQAIFGEGWADTAVLKYDGWTDDGLLGYVLANKESAPLIAGSTYLTTASPDGLMSAVTNLTDAASTVIKNYSGDVEGKLQSLLGSDFVNNLKNTGVTSDDEEYETVISNMMVGHFANTLNNSSIEEIQASADGPVQMMLVYAELYAYCETIGDTSTIDSLNTYLAGADDMDQLKAGSLYTYLSENDPTFVEGFMAFAGEDEAGNPGQGMKDMEAALEIMGAVGHVAGTYTDKESLSDPNLYASDSVAGQLDNYINAINAVANMDTTALGAISDGSVVVFVAEDGAVSVVPGAAYLIS